MKDEFGYDVSFRIPDFTALARRIVIETPNFHKLYVGKVEYRDFDQRLDEVFERNAMHKDTRFAWQNEIRAVIGVQNPSDDLIVKIPGMEAYVCDWESH